MRRLGSTVTALCITLALFALMQAMIGRQETPIEPLSDETEVSLVAAVDQAGAANDDAAADTEAASLPPPPEPAPPVPLTPPPPVAAPTPPRLTPPPVIEPELARIEPGAKPYLGAVTKPRAKPKPKPKARPKPAQPPQSASRSATQSRAGDVSAGRAASRSNAGDRRSSGRAESSGARAQAKPKAKGPTRAATPISTPRPPYPPSARRARREGWVDVQFTITTKGRVTNPRVVGSSPKGVFDQAARRAIQRWRFRPRLVNGKPASQSARQRIYFRLR